MSRKLNALLISLMITPITSVSLSADELLGDPTAGRRLAEDVCSACHVVAPGQESTTDIGAPAFLDLAEEPRVTALSLRVFLQTPHDRMPDLRLAPEETDDVIAYILSLER